MGDVCLDFFHAINFRSSEHAKKWYIVYILSGLSWTTVPLGTGATSYKQLVQVSLIFKAFSISSLKILSVFK